MAAPARRLYSLLLAAPLVALATPSPAAGPAVDTKRFPRLVRLLLLPEEREILKGLEDEKDKREFQKIFWARRDPSPGTPANEFEDSVRMAWKGADDLFSYPNQKGSETGCGQVLALLGRPEEVRDRGDVPRTPSVSVGGKAAQERGPDESRGLRPGQFDNMAYLREGSTREPETWVYRDRPGLPYSFTGGEIKILFDSECRFPEGGILAQDLQRAAEAFVTRPDVAYTRGGDGRLLPFAGAGAGPAGGAAATALLSAPRTDFPLAVEAKLLVRAPKGEAYVAGLLRAEAGAPAAPARLSVAAQAVDGSGQAAASSAREVAARPEADGSLVASWGVSLRPGRYKLTVAAHLQERGAVSAIDVEVPDVAGATLVASPLVLYPDEPPAAGASDPRDPYAAMQLGPMRLHPRFGNVYAPADALRVVATLYGGRVDPATGQAALRSRFTILKAGKPVARGAEDVFVTPDAVASVGPIPLADYAPGSYVVRLDVTDKVTGQTLRQEAPLEIRTP